MKYDSLRYGLQLALCPSINGGGGIVPDLSGRNNHGVLTNMDATGYKTYTRGVGLNFGGVDDFVSCGQITSTPGNSTVACWIYMPSLATAGIQFICGNSNSAGAVIETHLETFNNSFGPLWGSGPYYRPGPNLGISANTLYHVALLRYGTTGAWTAEIYLNGVSSWSGSTSINPGAADVWSIGRTGAYAGPSSTYYAGQLDDQRLYSRVLTPHEIQLLASEPGIGLRPERTSVFFGAQLFQTAWLAQHRNIIGGGVC